MCATTWTMVSASAPIFGDAGEEGELASTAADVPGTDATIPQEARVAMIRLFALALVVGLLSIPASLSAHHSWPVTYGKLVTVKGTVTSFTWSNPHPMIELDVPTADGKVEKWSVGGPLACCSAQASATSLSVAATARAEVAGVPSGASPHRITPESLVHSLQRLTSSAHDAAHETVPDPNPWL